MQNNWIRGSGVEYIEILLLIAKKESLTRIW